METPQNSVSRKIHPGPAFLRIFFFITGIIATIAYRITPFLTPLEVKISWYIGTVGFIIYFWHRAHIEDKRSNLVKDYNLVEAVNNSSLFGEEKTAVSYLVKTSLTSKAKFNSWFIVVASFVALVFSIAIDLHLHF